MDESLVRNWVADLKDQYVNLFILMERALEIPLDAPNSEKRQADLNAEIASRMQVIEGRMRRLTRELGDWRRTSQNAPVDLRKQVDEFFQLLDQGLTALQGRLDSHTVSVRERQTQLAETIRNLQRNRRGVKRYGAMAPKPKLLDSEA